ncbi:MAG: thiamine-phosphate kinase [Nitrospiraceae bacterium]|nr:thiamine-phosphate kinase [Nitrospiraceae bacterium]
MRLADTGELQLLERLKRRFRALSGGKPGLVVGIGDDAAVIRPGRRQMLLTTDMMVEDIHFDLRWTTPFQLGYKLVSRNVSDICAMGGSPEYLLLNYAAPAKTDLGHFDRFLDGLACAVEAYGISLIGGDMSVSVKTVLSATVLGSAARVIKRSGAQQGDYIHVTGWPGDAAAGLSIMRHLRRPIPLETGVVPKTHLPWEVIEPLVRRHLMPVAVSPDGFAKHATAMIDISDGLLMDLERLCRESGVGAKIWSDKIPISRGLAAASRLLKVAPLELALGGGEDYELLFTSASDTISGATCIGEIVRAGVKVLDPLGKHLKMNTKGYEHFGI